MIVWFLFTFPLFVLWGILSAYTLRIRFSGEKLWDFLGVKFIVCMIFNSVFGFVYFRIVKFQEFPVLGFRPDLIADYPLISYIAIFCIYIHGFAFPVKRELSSYAVGRKKIEIHK